MIYGSIKKIKGDGELSEKLNEWRERWNNGDVKFVPELLDMFEKYDREMTVDATHEGENQSMVRTIIDTTEVAVDENDNALCMLVNKQHFFWLIKQAKMLDELQKKEMKQ